MYIIYKVHMLLEMAMEANYTPYFDGFVGSYEPFFSPDGISIFPCENDSTNKWIRLDVLLDIHKLVLRHSAILGSTGSGKSNSVVAIIKQICSQMHNSRMLLIDPHGEYASAFPAAKVFRIGDSLNPLYIPFWLMNFDELMYFLVGAKPIDDQRPEYRNFREIISQAKKATFT